jgi:hypothetical protein
VLSENCKKRLFLYVCLSVSSFSRMKQHGSFWMDFSEIWYSSIFRKSFEKIQIALKSDKNNGYFRWRPTDTHDSMSLNSSYNEKIFRQTCRENQNKYFVFNFFFRKSCRLWDNVEKYGTARQVTDDNIIRRIRFAFWMNKATDTHSEYVIIIAFPRQQWLRERASMLRCSYTACLVVFCHQPYTVIAQYLYCVIFIPEVNNRPFLVGIKWRDTVWYWVNSCHTVLGTDNHLTFSI